MRLHRWSLAGIALALSAPFSFAQQFRWDGGDPVYDGIDLSSVSGAIGRSCTGDFDGDGSIDAAFLIGGKIVFCRSPQSWSAVYDTGITANDIETSGYALGETMPNILYVDSTGLHKLDWNGSGFSVVDIALGGGWANAKALRCRVVNPAPGQNPMPVPTRYTSALASNANAKVVTRVTQGAFVTEFEYPLTEPGGDFVLALWNSIEVPVIAMVCWSGLQITQLDGTVLRSYANVGPRGDAVAITRGAGDPYERVAWLRRLPGPLDQQLFVCSSFFDADGMTSHEIAWTSSGTRALSMRSLDATEAASLTADGDLDLLCSDGTCLAPQILQNQSPSLLPNLIFPQSGAIERLASSCESPVNGNYSWPAVADFDFDGRLDVIAPYGAPRSLQTFYSRYVPGGLPSTSPISFWGDQVFDKIDCSAPSTTSPIDTIGLRLLRPGLSNAGTAFNVLQVTVWYQAHEDAPPADIRSIGNYYYNLNSGTYIQSGDDPDVLYPVVSLVVPSPNPDPGLEETGDDSVYWIEVRGRRYANPAMLDLVESTGPSWVVFITASCEGVCLLKTGQTGFHPLDLYNQEVPWGDSGTSCACAPPLPLQSPSASSSSSWTLRPEKRLTGGTRRLIAPSGVPSTTLPSAGPIETGSGLRWWRPTNTYGIGDLDQTP